MAEVGEEKISCKFSMSPVSVDTPLPSCRPQSAALAASLLRAGLSGAVVRLLLRSQDCACFYFFFLESFECIF